MKSRTLAALCGAFVLATFLGAFSIARAQTPGALPTGPDAGQKAAAGGYTGARASLPGDKGSPLEPYLFLAILAGGGIVAFVFAIGTDVAVQKGYRKAPR